MYCTTFLNSSLAVIPGLTGRGAVSWSDLSDMSGDDVLQPAAAAATSDKSLVNKSIDT